MVTMPELAEAMTPAQKQRRQRILAAALDLADDGGFDGVQMREVASVADVALGTLYRYFPSKEALLVSAMSQSVQQLAEHVAQLPARGDTPADRVIDVLCRANRFLFARPNMTTAMLKALATTAPEVGEPVREVREAMNGIITSAIRPDGEPSRRDLQASRVLTFVWLSSLLTWITGLEPATRVDDDLAIAARLLMSEE